MTQKRTKAPAAVPEESPASVDNLSAVVARVLDQLSVTSWLPAAFLVAGGSILLQFRVQENLDIPQAIDSLTNDPLQVLVISLPLLVLATMITQAFSFQAIRLLEGYSLTIGPFSKFQSLMISRHAVRKGSLGTRLRVIEDKAFDGACTQMRTAGVDEAVVLATSEMRTSNKIKQQLSEIQRNTLDATDWQQYSDPAHLAVIDRLVEKIDLYPSDSRIMPTALGNCLRSYEDQLGNAIGDVENFVFHTRGRTSVRLRMHHDQFRNRLDMYCTLVLVSTALAVASLLLVCGPGISAWNTAGMSAFFLLVAMVSYRSAIHSANGYGRILVLMKQQ